MTHPDLINCQGPQCPHQIFHVATRRHPELCSGCVQLLHPGEAKECRHGRQVRIGDEWVCEACYSLMDTETPDRVVAS